MSELKVQITSPEGDLFNGLCHLAVVPSTIGDIGFMYDHEIIVASLREGEITLYDAAQKLIKSFPVKSGFAKMQSEEKLLVLVD